MDQASPVLSRIRVREPSLPDGLPELPTATQREVLAQATAKSSLFVCLTTSGLLPEQLDAAMSIEARTKVATLARTASSPPIRSGLLHVPPKAA